MAYFIYKGVNSNDVNGIVVQTLPPITNAPIRVETIEINGVDGDRTNLLGRKAYDKVINIGLSWDYEINEIMDWLSGSGKLIMSTDPNYYYDAKILNQIDYSRLLVFKTANITFHCQPYKYLINENPITVTYDSSEERKQLEVENKGYINSLPKITITGTGTVEFKMNNTTVFSLSMNDVEDTITVDSTLQDAYTNSINNLRNRSMTGYFPELLSGSNLIELSGAVTKVEVNLNSRWI